MSYVVGVDTGGTFTDTVLIDRRGSLVTGKAPTTPDDPSEGVIDSLKNAAKGTGEQIERVLSDTDLFVHGTTLTTNTVIERTGSDVGLITTRGNRDVLSMARVKTRHEGLTHEELQDYVEQSKPDLLVPKQHIVEIDERVDFEGEVLVPVDDDQIRDAINELKNEVDAIAVNLLWSFNNDAHEMRIAEIGAEEAPETPVHISSEIAPKIGEYERLATTIINAYTAPILVNYLDTLRKELADIGLSTLLYLMSSSGGVIPVEEAGRRAVGTIESGPTGGVTGSQFIGKQIGQENLICTDVGGTSFDVGLVVGGELQMRPTTTVQRYTLYQPSADIRSIGSGGGSIAHIDEAGALRVGPESAGADPGPACYGWGGSQPTVTDADLLLGYLDTEYFLGGQLDLDRDAAEAAVMSEIAEPLGMSLEEAAEGIFQIANASMADLLRNVTVERGHDPRDFSILAYGGAGPLHAPFYGDELGAEMIVVPLGDTASVFSAFGISTSDLRYAEELSSPMTAPFDPDDLMNIYDELESEIRDKCEEAGINPEDASFSREAELRYKQQVHQVDVAVPSGELSVDSMDQIIERFNDRYEAIYGIGATEGGQIELVTLRVFANVAMADPDLEQMTEREGSSRMKTRRVYWPAESEYLETDILEGVKLRTGDTLGGPAVVHYPDTTVTVRPHHEATIDEHHNLIIKGT